MIKLIAMDLDGTLVYDKEIGRKDREAVLSALKEDVIVVPTTTRLRGSTSRFFDGISIDSHPLICNNGARILSSGWSDPKGFSTLNEIKIEEGIAEKIASYADEKGYRLSTIFPEKVYRVKAKSKKSGGPNVGFVQKNIDALEYGTPINFMIHEAVNDLETLLDLEKFSSKTFGDAVRLDRHHKKNEYRSLTIYSKEVSKLGALRSVCCGFDIKMHDVLAIGDDEVDKGMIEEAGVGVAMIDSPDSVKKVADEIAPSCEDNGVAWALKRYLL